MRVLLSAVTFALAASFAAPASAQDAAAGERVYRLRCLFCHANTTNDTSAKQGPHLVGIVGTKAGTRPGFEYSEALKASALTWDEDTLKRYSASPTQVVPGGKMTQPGPNNPQQLTDLVAYLATLR